MRVSVSGVIAPFADMSHVFDQRLPVFIAVVIGLSFVLLLVVFRSVLVPLKAAEMNLLSIGAACGVAVAVFQRGWASAVLGVDRPIDHLGHDRPAVHPRHVAANGHPARRGTPYSAPR